MATRNLYFFCLSFLSLSLFQSRGWKSERCDFKTVNINDEFCKNFVTLGRKIISPLKVSNAFIFTRQKHVAKYVVRHVVIKRVFVNCTIYIITNKRFFI